MGMTFEELIDFLENKMSMSHIYQPLMISCLVDADGTSTIRQLAQEFSAKDEGNLRDYEKRIKAMPLRVLKSHGVVKQNDNLVSLDTPKLTLEQKAKLKQLCEQKISSYIEKHGSRLWDYRLQSIVPVPKSVRYKVLKAGGNRCALCGATKKDKVRLEVDHIIPKSRKGTNDISNLQVLCEVCNRAKSNKDDTDFRNNGTQEKDSDCLFCSEELGSQSIEENDSVFAVMDNYQVTEGHMLIIPKRHTLDFFSMDSKERRDAEDLIRYLRNKLQEEDPSIRGFNVGVNCGESAGQTVMHAHIHLIPRRDGDTPNPRGGVRGVVPDKMDY